MFIELLSACTIESFGGSWPSNYKGPIKWVFLNNRLCQARPTLANINSNQSLYYPFIFSVNKYGGNCNTVNDPCVSICVSKKLNKHGCEGISGQCLVKNLYFFENFVFLHFRITSNNLSFDKKYFLDFLPWIWFFLNN